MEHEVVVEGFVLQVEVTHCLNIPPAPGSRNSDWDAMGERELEFKLIDGRCYDDDGVPMDVPKSQLREIETCHYTAIMVALWHEIDSQRARERRVA
jgi:hypothetical protein